MTSPLGDLHVARCAIRPWNCITSLPDLWISAGSHLLTRVTRNEEKVLEACGVSQEAERTFVLVHPTEILERFDISQRGSTPVGIESDLRSWKRAGDGNRTRVLSLGSPSGGVPLPAEKQKSPVEHISHLIAAIRYCTLFVVACCTKWVRRGVLHAVARRGRRFSGHVPASDVTTTTTSTSILLFG